MSAKRVYTSGGSKPVSGYHLGNASKSITAHAKPTDAVPHNKIPYSDIKRHCLKEGVLFEDPDFPAVDDSLFFSKKPPRPFAWKRPKEIVSNPRMFVGGASRFDITQGMLGDCWLLAAVAALTQYEGLLYQVVPPECDFDNAEYCGVFRFRFWQYGQWEEVVVDDRLPTYNNKLVFLHSAQNNEFWSALLEKAYAKLCGSYEALKGGQTSEAMEDFTGGVTEVFDLKKPPNNFFKLLVKAQDRQSLMCCSIEAKPNEIEAKLDNGLIKGHAYTVTGVQKVRDIELLRIRNPWGNEREWTGAWSDESDDWRQFSEAEKKEIGLTYDDDGEFWMSYNDFMSNFTRVEICMLSPDSAGDSDKKRWEMEINQGTWQKHVSAGGCRNFPDTFYSNPQYRVTLEDPDDDDEVDNCTIVLGLIQKGRRKVKRVGAQNLTIGFAIYRLEEDKDQYIEDDRLSKDFFLYHKSFARSANFINAREVTGRFSLPPGDYVIMPSTFKNNEEGDFILRMFSEKPQSSSAMDTQTTIEYKPTKVAPEENTALDSKLKPFFEKVAGADAEIDAFELCEVLTMVLKKDYPDMKQCSLEACRSMVAMVDRDRSGRLNFEEFRELWTTVLQWKNAFKQADDGSGDMTCNELRSALAKLGFKLSTPALSSICLRYANKRGNVSLDDFIQICCRVKSTFESYLSYQGKSFSLDDYIQSAIYT